MRKLTVTRTRKFAAWAVKMQIWISAEDGELTIKGTPCRKLGEVGNGKTAEFEIGEEAARIFVIANPKSAGIYSELYDLPAGNGDVSLVGHNELSPSNGNPFLFDNVPLTPEAAANRAENAQAMGQMYETSVKKGRKRGLIIGAAVFVVAIVAVLVSALGTNTFTADRLSIELPKQFKECDLSGGIEFSVGCFDSKNVTVYVDKYGFEAMSEYLGDVSGVSVGEFAISMIDPESGVEPRTAEGLVYTVSGDTVDGEELAYYDFYYKSDDAFWVLTVIAEKGYAEKHSEDFIKWAKSVKIAGSESAANKV